LYSVRGTIGVAAFVLCVPGTVGVAAFVLCVPGTVGVAAFVLCVPGTVGVDAFVLTAAQLCMCSRAESARCGARRTDRTAGDDNVPSCRSGSCTPGNPGPAVDNNISH